jgi:hypothetical protein
MQTSESSPDETGLSEADQLLTAMLDRPLTRNEQGRLLQLLQHDPGATADLAVLELIALHRAQTQIESGEQQALARYRALMASPSPLARNPAKAKTVHGGWLGWFDALLQRPVLIGSCLAIQVLFIGALLIGLGHEYSGARSVAPGGACGPFLLAMDDHLTLGELRRVLLQSDIRIVDGPDAQGRYAIAGADTLQQTQELLRPLTNDIRINPECRQKP